MKKVETGMQERGVEGKNKIKERFNELAKKVTIDTSEFVKHLLKKKEVSKKECGNAQNFIGKNGANTNLLLLQMKKLLNQSGDEESKTATEGGETMETTPSASGPSKNEETKMENMLDQVDSIKLE